MFLSRLSFHTLPGKTDEVEGKLMKLLKWVEEAGGSKPRIMRTHFGSIGAPDLLFEQEAEDLGAGPGRGAAGEPNHDDRGRPAIGRTRGLALCLGFACQKILSSFQYHCNSQVL